MYEVHCEVCGGKFESPRRDGKFCKECWNKIITSGNKANNNYSFTPKKSSHEHRRIAKEVLKRKLGANEVVHHLDENPKNNELTNLIVLSRGKHISLHRYLNIQRAIIEESMNENNENCWNNLRVPMTTAWLETTSVKVLKLWEIGQSASEHLSQQ